MQKTETEVKLSRAKQSRKRRQGACCQTLILLTYILRITQQMHFYALSYRIV